MDLLENIALAIAGLRANKMRTILTMLGIIIGIASVIAIMTVGSSMTSSVTSSMQGMGANNITVSLQEKSEKSEDAMMRQFRSVNGMGGGGNSSVTPEESDYITEDMIRNLREVYADQIQSISISESAGSGKVQDGHRYANISVMGTNDEYNDVSNLDMLDGRYINQKDMLGTKNVAVVSDKLVSNMFGKEDPLGKEIKVYIGKDIFAYTVIGVYKYENNSLMPTMASEEDISTSLYVPVTSAKKITGSGDGYQYFTITTKPGTN